MKRLGVILVAVLLAAVAIVSSPSFSETYQGLFSTRASAEEVLNEVDEEDKPSEESLVELDMEDEKLSQEENNIEELEEDVIDEVKNPNDRQGSSDPSKRVFLTFDDGPTNLTLKVLDVLKEHEVNATFFTVGRLMERYPEYVKRTYKEGNMVLTHSYSHDYAIYSTFDSFYEDLHKVEEVYKDILGFDAPPIFRFPGGSSNHSSFDYGGKQFMPMLTEDIKAKGYYYIDWNVSSGDASPDYNNKEKMLKNVLEGAEGKDYIVVLFHDTDRNVKMLEILPQIIQELKGRGYTFHTFKDISQEELDRMVELKLSNKPIIR